MGIQGGLYPGGSNTVPATHLATGVLLASKVEPLNLLGLPDSVDGRIVLVSVGTSNSRNIFSGQIEDEGAVVLPGAFIPLASADPMRNPQLVIVNGAQGGKAMAQ